MLLFHHTSTDGDQWSMSSDLFDLFPTAVEAIAAFTGHRLFLTELAHPLDDPLNGTPVVDPERIKAAIYAHFPELQVMPDAQPRSSFASA
jgi:hypothetical protein